METHKNKMNEVILNLTLEILCLLTGEDYTVLKRTSGKCVIPSRCPDTSGGWSRTQDQIMDPQYEKSNTQKILDLANKIIELLTGKVPIRCQDVAVYFSMEEWEYMEEHKDLYRDVIVEDHRPLTSVAGFGNKDQDEELNTTVPSLSYQKHENAQGITEESNSCNTEQAGVTKMTQYPSGECEERGMLTKPNIHNPVEHTMFRSPHFMEEPWSCNEGNFPSHMAQTLQYPFTHIKKEPASDDGGNLTEPNIYIPRGYTRQHTSTHIKEEPLSDDGGNPTEPNIYIPTDHTPYLFPPVKEEPVSSDGGTPMDVNIYTPYDYTQHPASHIKEEPHLCDDDLAEPNTYTPTDHTQHLTTFIKEESFPHHEETLIGLGGHTSTDHRQQQPTTYIKEEQALCHEDITDAKIGTSMDLTKHLFPRVNKEPISCNRESLADNPETNDEQNLTDPDVDAIPTDQTQYPSVDEPMLDKESSLQKHESSSPGEPVDKDVSQKRKNEIEEKYNDITMRSKKYFCTIQKTTNSLEILYNCPECPACFTSNVDLAKHQLNHTRKLPFICSMCGRCFGRKSDLVIHQTTHGGSDTDTNSYMPTDHTQTDIHPMIDSTEQVTNNPDSYDEGNVTNPDSTVPSDQTRHGPSVEEPLLDKESSLQKHQTSSADKDVSKKRKKTLEQNYNEVTISSKKYFCTVQQTTNSLEILYNCPECPECFTSNLDLAKHQIIHAGGMSIICAVCGRSFGRKSDLVIHQITHGGSSNFSCPHCDLCFATQSSLTLHEKTHKQRKLLPCPECGKTFQTKQRLARHMEKPHR